MTARKEARVSRKDGVQLVVVGSIGLDTIETPFERRENILGGSVSYACAGASFFTRTGMVGVVGEDFPGEYVSLYGSLGIDLAGLERVPGRTFKWSGVYELNMNNRRTLSTELNVFADFSPKLPESYQRAPFLFLANISPSLQLHVLSQVTKPRFVAADTMDLWINTARADLVALLARVDLVTLNDAEARQFTDEYMLLRAARKIMAMGPRFVVIKKGEHGSMLFSPEGVFMLPAYPVESLCDPTGAGDTFAGGFMGWLARNGAVDSGAVRQAMLYGCVLASFGVESFGLDAFHSLTAGAIDARASAFRGMISV